MNNFKIWLQYIVPQHAYTRLIGILAKNRIRWLKNWMIKTFIQRYQVDMSETVRQHPDDYETFNDFFTRHLKSDIRPVNKEPHIITCPVDGCISQMGDIDKESLFQAKGFHYSLGALLGNDGTLPHLFLNGKFTTLYLAPKDYHRIHMPYAGKLRETIYVPGALFSVNQQTTHSVPNLFTRNERLICVFDTSIGPMAIILIGAMIVGKIKTVWDNSLKRTNKITKNTYRDITLEKGEELGHFELGSTVILLFAENKMQWSNDLISESTVKMGEEIGTRK